MPVAWLGPHRSGVIPEPETNRLISDLYFFVHI